MAGLAPMILWAEKPRRNCFLSTAFSCFSCSSTSFSSVWEASSRSTASFSRASRCRMRQSMSSNLPVSARRSCPQKPGAVSMMRRHLPSWSRAGSYLPSPLRTENFRN